MSGVACSADAAAIDLAVCIYRISGIYSTVSRMIYYGSLLLGALFRHKRGLARSILAPAMIYTSVSVMHALVLLVSSGWNPAVLDLDIVAMSTTIVSTFWLSAMLMQSGAAFNSKARPFLIPWSVFLWFGAAACTLLTWKVHASPSAVHFLEPLCSGTERTSSATSPIILSSAPQLQMRNYNFTCTYACFSSLSAVRETDEILAIQHSDLYTRSLLHLTRLSLSATLLMPLIGLLALVRIWERLYLRRRSRRMARVRLATFSSCFVPGLCTIWFGERAMLRRDSLLKSESYRTVGQWSTIVCLLLVLMGVGISAHFARMRDERLLLIRGETGEIEEPGRVPDGGRPPLSGKGGWEMWPAVRSGLGRLAIHRRGQAWEPKQE